MMRYKVRHAVRTEEAQRGGVTLPHSFVQKEEMRQGKRRLLFVRKLAL